MLKGVESRFYLLLNNKGFVCLLTHIFMQLIRIQWKIPVQENS
jgi:hypothetical protein